MTQPDPPQSDTITIYKGEDTRWYWRRVAGNNQIIAVGGEGYDNEDDCANMAMALACPRNGVAPVMNIVR